MTEEKKEVKYILTLDMVCPKCRRGTVKKNDQGMFCTWCGRVAPDEAYFKREINKLLNKVARLEQKEELAAKKQEEASSKKASKKKSDS